MVPPANRLPRNRGLARLYHTVRHLRLRQIAWQIRRKIFPPKLAVTSGLPACEPERLSLLPFPSKPLTHLDAGRFNFLNREVDLGLPIDWNAEHLPLLWRYNLHYFDYLQQPSMTWDVGSAVMSDWVERHRVRKEGVGWQPYPISLRIVNWIKFLCHHEKFPPLLCQSLAAQGENLSRQIEYQILGNHLFSNGKALWFAGAFLQQQQWLRIGRTIILDQLKEQFLPDGGHFELSPMYHALAVEDLLDLINLCQVLGDRVAVSELQRTAQIALQWLAELVDSSGRFPLLNDSAYSIAPTQDDLARYSRRLGLEPGPRQVQRQFDHGWTGRNLSGYWVLENKAMRIIFDTAPLGSDYLPGHAHCDMLSVLMDFREQNVLCDTGVFEYAEGARRTYSRSTAAHNTVVLDGLEQAEIWKSFRVGRRGHPQEMKITSSELSCEHTGFAIWQRGLDHRRTIRLLENGFEWVDHVQGPGEHRFEAYFHFAPDVEITSGVESRFSLSNGLVFDVRGCSASLMSSEYYPQFGVVQERPCLLLSGTFKGKAQFGVKCTYFS